MKISVKMERFPASFSISWVTVNVVTHRIDTGDTIRQNPCRLPYAYREETSNQIPDMLKQDVVHPSNHGPLQFPLVKKRDGSFLFCVDD